MQSPRTYLLHTSAALALLATGTLAAVAAPAPVFNADSVEPVVIKHLPAGHDELVFRGEASRRSFKVFLSRGELDGTRMFQLALQNTVAVLPERSSVALSVNGHLLATVPTRSPNGVSTFPVAIPAGVLVPGFNMVDVSVAMTHRVDCSVAATYELWTLLDPSKTGFVIPTSSTGAVRALDELAGEPLADDGTTRIHLRLNDASGTAAIGRAARFIDALVNRAGLGRPVVDAGAGPGQGPGFDVVLTASHSDDDMLKSLRIVGREDGVTLARDPVSGRLALIMSGYDDADIDAQVSAFAKQAAHSPPSSAIGSTLIEGETRRSFANLGHATDNFSGRHYTTSLDVELPSDFYPANYDKARLLIDGAYATNLDSESNLVFRVNGALVSSLRLSSDRGGLLQHEIVELPLRFFHPGKNEIAIEVTTRTLADRQCDTAGATNGIRFTLADSSELDFPHFAHLGTTPQIPGAMANFRDGDAGSAPHLYLADATASSIGSGLTVLANLASGHPEMPGPSVHFGSPSGLDAPGIVVAPRDALPAALSAPLRAKTFGPVGLASNEVEATLSAPARDDSTTAMLGQVVQGRLDPRALLRRARRLLRNQGFFFDTDVTATTVPLTSTSLVIAAVDPRIEGGKVAGMEVPHFTSDPRQWLVVTSADADLLQAGLTHLVSNGQWKELRGDTVSVDLDKELIASVQPTRVLYVLPSHVSLSDVRPILGGIVSNNIELSLAVLVLLMALLGVSTHALIRRAGTK